MSDQHRHYWTEEVCRWNEELEAERGRARDHAALLEADGARLRERVAALANEWAASCYDDDDDRARRHCADDLTALLAPEGGEG